MSPRNMEPIFIHSLFRSGSTFIYNVVKRTGKFQVFHEPFHELIGSLPTQWENMIGRTEQLKSLLRHDFLNSGYFDEYANLLPIIEKKFHPDVSFALFFLDDVDESPVLKSYIDCLIDGSNRQPVLQCTRTMGRLRWLKRNYASKNLFLLRNPWDQWFSYKVDPYIASTPQIIYSQERLPKALQDIAISNGYRRLQGNKITEMYNYALSHPIEASVDYSLFFGLWIYSFLEGYKECDLVLDMDALSGSKAKRAKAQDDLAKIGLSEIDLTDCNMHHTIFKSKELGFYQNIEEQILSIFKRNGYLEMALESVQDYLSRERESLFVGEMLTDGKFKSTLEDASRLRATLISENQRLTQLVKNLHQVNDSMRVDLNETKAELSVKEDRLEFISVELAAKRIELNEILASRVWKAALLLRRIRIFIVPLGSFRERAWYKAFKWLSRAKMFVIKQYGINRKLIENNRIRGKAEAVFSKLKLRKIAREVKSVFKESNYQSPTASIIIPVYNQVDQTLACLLSIANHHGMTSYEVIVIDDGSTDETPKLLNNIEGIRYIRNTTNLGFLRSCNIAAQNAKGKYLVLLNNDTRVHSDWLDNLILTFSLVPKVGLVGSKLVFPNGKLQEAGGIIYADGSARNYGRNDDPKSYRYNFLREVDYVSGASIVLPITLWERLGGFDLQYQPAYFEDVDLAFRVREAGYKVIYQPFSQVTHYEGATSGIDLNTDTKRYQVINQQKFYKAWRKNIASHGDSSQTSENHQLDRSVKGRILYIDDGTPKPDRYAGSVLSEFYMIALRQDGYAVTFLPHIDLRYAGGYTQKLQKNGIECIYQPYFSSSEQYIKQHGFLFDYVIVSRANVASEIVEIVKEYAPNARIIFNTIDLHFIRFSRAAEISQKDEDIEVSRKVKESELSVIRKVDCTLVVSEVEKQLLTKIIPDVKVKVVPFPADLYELDKGFDERRDIVFLGGFLHKPNVDAVLYFANEIWPLVLKNIPDVKFIIAGADATREIQQLESTNILVKGFVQDLTQLFETTKLSIAPLRYGAGIKGKILTSLGYGVPCVATTIAAEGIGLVPGKNILMADTALDFANAICNIYTSAELWSTLSREGQNWIRKNYSRSIVASKLLDILKDL